MWKKNARIKKPKLGIFSCKTLSLNANHGKLFCLFDNPSNYPEILFISETWSNVENVHEIPNYKSYHIIRTSGRSGGVFAFVNSFVTSTRIPELCIVNDLIEILGGDI